MSSPLSSRLTLDALWRKRATMQPQAPALSGMTPDGPLSLSYGELAERVARLAGALRSAGVQREDGEDCLDCTSATQQVTSRRLGCRNSNLV